jgi:hypothetical protein
VSERWFVDAKISVLYYGENMLLFIDITMMYVHFVLYHRFSWVLILLHVVYYNNSPQLVISLSYLSIVNPN